MKLEAGQVWRSTSTDVSLVLVLQKAEVQEQRRWREEVARSNEQLKE